MYSKYSDLHISKPSSPLNNLITTPLLICIAVLLIITSSQAKSIQFQLTPNKHFLILYSSQSIQQQTIQPYKEQQSERQSQSEFQSSHKSNKNKPKIYFKINFNSTQISLSKQLQNTDLQFFFDKKLKYPLIHNITFQSKNIPKNVDNDGRTMNSDEQEYQGIIGFAPGSQFFKIIKQSFKIQHFKLWFRIYENLIQVIKEGCSNSIFPPYSIQMQTPSHNSFIAINHLSLNFIPQTNKFLNFINKKQQPFIMSPQQLHTKVNLQLLNQVATIPLHVLLGQSCRRISGSSNLQCDTSQNNKQKQKNNQDDFGLLLFQFDPIVCTERLAIQLRQQGKIDSVGYYWSHLLLIFVEFGILIIFKYRYQLSTKIKCFMKNRKLM